MKKWMPILAGLLVICFTAVGFAAPDGNRKDKRPGDFKKREFTQQQKDEALKFLTEKNKLHEQYLMEEVKAGRMKQEVANAHIIIMNDRLDTLKANNFARPARSEEAIAAHKAYVAKVKDLRIQSIKESVANGTITKEEGDRKIERINNAGQGKHPGKGPGERGDRPFYHDYRQ